MPPTTFVQINYAQISSAKDAVVQQHSEVIMSNGFSATGVADALCKRIEFETGIQSTFSLKSQDRIAEMVVFSIEITFEDEVVYIAGYGIKPTNNIRPRS